MPCISFSVMRDKLTTKTKLQTIRRASPKNKTDYQAGKLCRVYWMQRHSVFSQYLGTIYLTEVTEKKISEITEQEALNDGFSSLKALKRWFLGIYGFYCENGGFLLIEFNWIWEPC